MSPDSMELLRQLAAALNVSVEGVLEAPDPIPTGETVERFLAYQRFRTAPRTFATDSQRLRKFFEAVPVANLRDLTPTMITNELTRRAEAGAAPRTLNHVRCCVHTLFEWLIDQELIERNPVARVRRVAERAPEISYLRTEEVDQLLAMFQGHVLEGAVAMLVCTGLRRDELVWLRGQDVDLERRMVRVVAKTVDGGTWQSKTKRNRQVPISNRLVRVLERVGIGSKWAFPTPSGERWRGDSLYWFFTKVVQAHGKPWTILDLRHTFATQLAAKGVSLAKIAALMGNSPEICRRHYAHIATEDMHSDVEF